MTKRLINSLALCVLACSSYSQATQGHGASDPKLAERSTLLERDFRPAVAGAKVAVAEYYARHGSWPRKNEDAGAAAPTTFRERSMRSLEINGQTITVTFDARSGVDDGKIVFTGTADDDASTSVHWTCESPNITDIASILPECMYVKPHG